MATTSKDDAQVTQTRPAQAHPLNRQRRWLRRLLVVGGLMVVFFFFRGIILFHLARVLIVDDRPAAATCLMLFSGDQQLELAQKLARDGARFLVFRDPQTRLQKLKIVPDWADVVSNQLQKRNVPADRIEILACSGWSDWALLRRLRDWLIEHPDAEVCLLCARFDSRRMQGICRNTLAEAAGRVHVCPVPYRTFDETNWWHSKAGVSSLVQAYTRLAYYWCAGEDTTPIVEFDPDAYEKSLRERSKVNPG